MFLLKNYLETTLHEDVEKVVKGIEKVHSEHTSILSYNNKNSLSCKNINAPNHNVKKRKNHDPQPPAL